MSYFGFQCTKVFLHQCSLFFSSTSWTSNQVSYLAPEFGASYHAVLSSMLHKSNVSSTVDESCTMCFACIHGKMSRLPFSEKTYGSLFPFDKIHSDIWGHSPIRYVEGYTYYVTFVDDCTKFVQMFPLCNKLDLFQIFVRFHTFVLVQFGISIKCFQSNGGGDFTVSNLIISWFLKEWCIRSLVHIHLNKADLLREDTQ